jgi:hypothetical protein
VLSSTDSSGNRFRAEGIGLRFGASRGEYIVCVCIQRVEPENLVKRVAV